MRSSQPLKDEVYITELDRLRHLPGFPEVPVTRQAMVREMRKVTRDSRIFLHQVITYFVDHGDRCPTGRELIERAATIRAANQAQRSDPGCPKCGGTGWTHGTKTVAVGGMPPYEAEYSARCECASAG